jgi:hypothetical protein
LELSAIQFSSLALQHALPVKSRHGVYEVSDSRMSVPRGMRRFCAFLGKRFFLPPHAAKKSVSEYLIVLQCAAQGTTGAERTSL